MTTDNGGRVSVPGREALAAAIRNAMPLMLDDVDRYVDAAMDAIMPLVVAYGDERYAAGLHAPNSSMALDAAYERGYAQALAEARAKTEALRDDCRRRDAERRAGLAEASAEYLEGYEDALDAALGGDDATE